MQRSEVESETPSTRRRTGVSLAIIVVMQLMFTVDLMIVTVALPSIGQDLGFSEGGLAWVVNAYGLALGGLMLLGGRFGDSFGRRRLFLIGVVVFTAASLAGGVATSDWWFIACRAAQGVGAAMAMPNCLALIFGLFPAGPTRTKAITISASASSAGAVVGLLLGGVLTTGLSWRWVMFVNVPVGVAVIVLGLTCLAEQQRRRGRFDLAGGLTSAVGVALLVYGLSEAGEAGWGSSSVWLSVLIGGVLFACFIFIERKAPEPIMPLSLFTHRNRVAAYVAAVLVSGSMIGMSFFLTMFVQGPLGFSALVTGLAFLATGGALVTMSMFVGAMMRRIGERWTMVTGGLLLITGYLWLTSLSLETGYWTGIFGPLVLVGAGMACTLVPATEMAGADVGATGYGAASSTYNTMQQLGGPIVLVVLVTLFQNAAQRVVVPPEVDDAGAYVLTAATTPGFVAAAVFAGCVCVVSLLVRRTPTAVETADAAPESVGTTPR